MERGSWSNIGHAARGLLDSPGLIAGTAGPEHLYRGAMTFTIWRSLDDALRFSYREQPHRQIVKDVRDRGLLTDSMFIRLAPFAAEGRWPPQSRFASRFDAFNRSLGPSRDRPTARAGLGGSPRR